MRINCVVFMYQCMYIYMLLDCTPCDEMKDSMGKGGKKRFTWLSIILERNFLFFFSVEDSASNRSHWHAQEIVRKLSAEST